MAEINAYIDPDATGGGTGVDWTNAYTSLSAAEAARESDLVSDEDNIIFHCKSSSGTADTTTVLIGLGWTTSDTYDIVIQVDSADRHDGSWDTSAYRLEVTDDTVIQLREDYITVIGLQIKTIYSSSTYKTCVIVRSQTATNNLIRLTHCIITTNGSASGGLSHGISGIQTTTNLEIENTIIYAISRRALDFTGSTLTCKNITVYDCLNDGIFTSADLVTVTILNALVFNTQDDFDDRGATTYTVTYSASDDAQTGTGNFQITQTASDYAALVTDAPNGDFSVKDASSELYNAGTNTGAPSDDIIGTSRPQDTTTDIGAFEFPVASGGYTLTADSGTFAQTGIAADLLKGSLVGADSGTYSQTGTDASLLFNRKITADGGTYTQTGSDISFLYDRVIDIETGEYLLTGSDVNFGGAKTISADSGTYTQTGFDVTLRENSLIDIENGTFSLTGTDNNLSTNRILRSDSGSFIHTGSNATLIYAGDIVIICDPGEYLCAGGNADLSYSGESTGLSMVSDVVQPVVRDVVCEIVR